MAPPHPFRFEKKPILNRVKYPLVWQPIPTGQNFAIFHEKGEKIQFMKRIRKDFFIFLKITKSGKS